MSETPPKGWRWRSLAEMGAYENGFAFNDQHWSEEGLPIVRIAQITGSQGIVDRYPGRLPDKFLLASGDMIFSWSGTLAVVRWQGGPAWLNQHLFKVTPAANIDAGFFFHVLSESVAEFDKRAHGSTMKHIKRGELSEHAVAVPDDPLEQAKIAEVLDTLDAAIRGTEAVVAKLRAMKQGLLHDLLTRGIDANGDLRPPQPEAPHLYHQTPLGWLPRGWDALPLGDYTQQDITYGIVQAGPHIVGGIPYVRTGDMSGEALVRENMLCTSERIARSYRRSEVRAGELVIAIRATLGKVLPVPDDLDGANLTQGTARISPRANVNPTCLMWAIRHRRGQDAIMKEVKGSTFMEISLGSLRKVLMALPRSRQEQDDIAVRLTGHDVAIAKEQALLDKLRLQKSGLMDDLLTGRVPVTPLL
jgi:type I restriction enzyme S subunit